MRFHLKSLKPWQKALCPWVRNLQDISTGLSLFQTKSTMMEASVPSLASEMDLVLYEEGSLRSAFNDVVVSDTQVLMMIKLDGNLNDTEKERLTNLVIASIDDAGFTTLNPTISGKTVLDMALRSEMKSSMMVMVALAVLIHVCRTSPCIQS